MAYQGGGMVNYAQLYSYSYNEGNTTYGKLGSATITVNMTRSEISNNVATSNARCYVQLYIWFY